MKKNNNYELDFQQLEQVTGGALALADGQDDFPNFPFDPNELDSVPPVMPIGIPNAPIPLNRLDKRLLFYFRLHGGSL